MRRLPEYKPPLHSTAPPLHTEATPFVVISLPKSGSTWAWDMLNTHPRVAMDAETLFFWEKVVRCVMKANDTVPVAALLQSFREIFMDGYGASLKFAPGYASKSVRHCYGHRGAQRQMPWKGKNVGAYGFKWFPPTQGAPSAASLAEVGRWFAEHGVSVVLLERTDLVDHFVSDMMGRRHARSAHGSSKHNKTRVVVNLRTFPCEFARLKAAKLSLRQLLRGTRSLYVSYEDLAAESASAMRAALGSGTPPSPGPVMTRLLRFLRVDVHFLHGKHFVESHPEGWETYALNAKEVRGLIARLPLVDVESCERAAQDSDEHDHAARLYTPTSTITESDARSIESQRWFLKSGPLFVEDIAGSAAGTASSPGQVASRRTG